MKALEMETAIQADGKLPAYFHEAFGKKARVIVLLEDEGQTDKATKKNPLKLSDLAGKIRSFRDIDDPVAYQRNIRDEWGRGTDDVK